PIAGRAPARMRDRRFAWGLIAIVLLAVATVDIARLYRPHTFLIGDCQYYAATAISILIDRDLDLRNQLAGGVEVHDLQISRGPHGEWYPKHPIVMPVASVPLLALFGIDGFLIGNVIVLVALGLVLYELARTVVPPPAAVGGAIGTILGSFI